MLVQHEILSCRLLSGHPFCSFWANKSEHEHFFCALCLQISRSCVVLLHQMNESDTTYTHSTSWIHLVRNSTSHFRHIKGLSTTGRHTSALFMALERTMCNHLLMDAGGGTLPPILHLCYPLCVWLLPPFPSGFVFIFPGCINTHVLTGDSQMFSWLGFVCQQVNIHLCLDTCQTRNPYSPK